MKTFNLARSVAVLLAFGLAGCQVEKVGTVDLTGVCSWPDAGDCAFSGECEAYYLGRPYAYTEITAGVSNELIIPVEVRNQVPDNADDSSGQTNSNDAYLRSWELSFSSAAFGAPIASASYPATAARIPAGGTAVSIATVVPWTVMQAISDELTAQGVSGALVRVDVRVKGSYGSADSGRNFESGTMPVLVELYDMPAGAYACPVAGEVVVATCPPNVMGQYASIACEAPAAP